MELNAKQKNIIIAVVAIFIIVIVIYTIISKNQTTDYTIENFLAEEAIENNENSENIDLEQTNNEIIGEALKTETIVVHITGQVKNAGIIELLQNARIADAIEAAGGVTSQADLDKVNLAYVLSDGQKIYIPSKNEENSEKTYITSESGNNVIIADNLQSEKNQKVNINDANQEKLEELPGIGPSIAQKIIEYRKKIGKFTSIEQLLEVSGIGEAKYAKIKEYVVVK